MRTDSAFCDQGRRRLVADPTSTAAVEAATLTQARADVLNTVVTLSARSTEFEVIFSVADNGPGIPHEHQLHLFERFWQAHYADRRGIGLGLSITRNIVNALGGRLWVESTVRVGSVFSFALCSTAVPTPPHGAMG